MPWVCGGTGVSRIGDQQPASHAQVHDPLQAGRRASGEIEDYMFADAIDAFDAAAG